LEVDRNIFADLLTRWVVRSKDILASGKIERLVTVPLAPLDCDEEDWPSIDDKMNSQRAATVSVPGGFRFVCNMISQFRGRRRDSR
jgi:hypothetical protein